jgi:predicted ATPase
MGGRPQEGATLPSTPALRQEQIKLQVALINPLMHVIGHAAPETIEAEEKAHLLIEQAEVLGEKPEDPLLLLSVLYGVWVANYAAFNGDVLREVAAQALTLAEKQGATVPLTLGHRLMGSSLMTTGSILQARAHYDRALALYDPVEHRRFATRFGQEIGVTILGFRSLCLWFLGYPEAALADADRGLSDAHEFGQATTLMYALSMKGMTQIFCGNYEAATTIGDELVALADEKGAVYWKSTGTLIRGSALALSGSAPEAVSVINSGVSAYRSIGVTVWIFLFLTYLAKVYAKLGRFDDAWHAVREAMNACEATKQRWYEAEVYRTAGEIALMSPEPDVKKAELYFNRALAIAREQQAKSWELRAAMSMARLWRDQGKRQQAHDLLASVYGWFTEGFDTIDLKEARALLDALSS